MTDFLLIAFVFLIAGIAAVPVAARLGLGSVLGYLLAGIAIGPILALLHVDIISIQHFAEFGVVMMLFIVGLELEPRRLWEIKSRLVGLGGGQLVLTAALIMGIAVLLGQSWSVALAVGLILALSSTAIVLQTLSEKGLSRSDGGQSAFSVLLFQDIAVIPMLALIPLLAMPELIDVTGGLGDGANDPAHGGLSLVEGLNGWQTALATLAAIAAVILGGNYLTGPVFRFIAVAQLRELFTATALAMVVGIALLMSLVGVSPALGTFLAGVVLANSDYRHELESDIDPFKGLLLGVFFISVGASINFGLLMEGPGRIVALTVGLIAIKTAVQGALGFAFRLRGSDRWLFALGLSQAGEFGFVLLTFSVANAVIPAELANQLLLVVALSMLITPLLFVVHDRVIAPVYAKSQEREADEIGEASHIIIAEAGRVGGIVRRMLEAGSHKPTVIDYSSKQVDIVRAFGFPAYFGDATRPDLLHAAGISSARLLVVAIDDREQINELVQYALRSFPNLHVMARALDRDHVYHLWAMGCRDIIRETYDSSIRMGRSAFEALGATREQADRAAEEFSATDRQSMIELAGVYDLSVPAYENKPYVAKVREIQAEWGEPLRQRVTEILAARDG